MASVDETEVRRLAELARLALSDAEVATMTSHLDSLLGYIARIQALDVTGATQTVHVGGRSTPLRPDVARPGFPREVMTAGAPSAPAGLFEVPKVLGAGAGSPVDEAEP